MKATAAVLALFLVAGTAWAQEEPPAAQENEAGQEPDYSRESLLRLAVDIPQPPDRDRNVRFRVGAVEFGALGTEWRFVYLPLMPLPGSILRTTQQWPDAFSLTGTPIATGPRAWRAERARNAELRRINRMERAKLRVQRE